MQEIAVSMFQAREAIEKIAQYTGYGIYEIREMLKEVE